MMKVKQYSKMELPVEIGCQVASFIRLVWMGDQRGDARFWQLSEIDDPTEHFVCVERGVLISHALVRLRELSHAGEQYDIQGVGAVMTYPAFRGEGYGRLVVEAASAYIRESGADIGMLFCNDTNVAFYEKCGWEAFGKPGVLSGDRDAPRLDTESNVMMLFVSERAKAHHDDFTKGDIYVGGGMW